MAKQSPPVKRLAVLITGARSPVALEWARLFSAAGFRVVACDSVPYSLCADSRAVSAYYSLPAPNDGQQAYLAALKGLVVAEEIDWVWPTCEEIFHIAAGYAELSRYALVFTEPIAKLHELHDKWSFIQKLKQWGWLAPETWIFDDAGALQSFCASFSAGQLVIKPVYSRFASRVMFYDGRPPAFRAGEVSRQSPWLVQRAIQGQAYCTYSIAVRGRLLAHTAYAAEFTAGPGAAIAFEALDMPRLQQWAADFAAKENFTGQLAFDFIMTSTGELFPLECNPRTTSGIHLFHKEDALPELLFKQIATEPVADAAAAPAAVLNPPQGRLAVIRPAMLLYGLKQLRSAGRLGRWWTYVIRGRDAVFRREDQRPAWKQPYLVWMFWRIARKRKVSMLEATTLDIEWNGEP